MIPPEKIPGSGFAAYDPEGSGKSILIN